ncbi:SCP-like protein, partial [Cooperia oncophora]
MIRPSGSNEITEHCGDEMSVEVRQALLDNHNRERSRVAKGNYTIKAPGSGLSRLPPAKRMYQLKYNCSLERSARKWVQQAQCQIVHSNWHVGENIYVSADFSDMKYV